LPLYEYECLKCGHRFEKIESVTAPHRQKCPRCRGRAERRLAAPAIQFKGSGWYVTDYAGKSGGAKAESAEGASKESKEGKEAPGKEAAKKPHKHKHH
jgi:putative FmdB family regulatory protein